METASYDPTLSSKEVHSSISALGVKKANTRMWQLFCLSTLAGLYIALGAHVYLVALQQGLGKIVGGAVFSVGLILVVIAGAELFTGNLIMVVGAISKHFRRRRLFHNWTIVYIGNLFGSVMTALLIWHSGLLGSAGQLNELGAVAQRVAEAKLAIPFTEALIRGVFCNILVIMAIILATISKDVISKIFCCVFPIMTFVACGFEHCVANMYLIPLGLFAKGVPLLEQGVMFRNVLPVTLGNILGALFILFIHPNRIRQLVMLWQAKHPRRPSAA
ncbi:MAG: formate/nitrite transporter family protein [Lentisphaerae bacterium]|nr:formate/nitrite transporter family protein [Lentisphaerota bacterium]